MSNKQSNKLETWGNESTMNMNAILHQNILASPYFKSLYEKKTFHEVVDEIYYEAPFIKGTTPSTAFCCLYKFWTQRLTVKQVENLVEHPDSPYLRAIGFLYLRYVLVPAQYWDWFQYYLDDDEEIDLTSGPNPQKSTIGKLCRMLLTEQKFLGTMLPRIPVPIARDLEKKLKEYDREHGHEAREVMLSMIMMVGILVALAETIVVDHAVRADVITMMEDETEIDIIDRTAAPEVLQEIDQEEVDTETIANTIDIDEEAEALGIVAVIPILDLDLPQARLSLERDLALGPEIANAINPK
ncbi:hypothetical protein VTP01DRAFT_6262 [Rhizomucor pusillus]|uniref:uncharacterized protein n=1 Tax=Rhizomucor pusillus TaxID=4840 RepID=UPI003742DB78